MYVEVVDVLRCPRPHAAVSLVASVDTLQDRAILAGTLGCPACDARYPIVNGAVVFDAAALSRARIGPPAVTPMSTDNVMRLAAALDLAEPGGVVLLHGEWAAAATALLGLVDTAVVLLNPRPATPGRGVVSPLYGASLPIVAGTMRGAALDADAPAWLLDTVATTLRPRGRVVLSGRSPSLGETGFVGLREVARDASVWVGERAPTDAAAAPPVALGRRRRT